MSERVEVKEEKNITIDSDKYGGSVFKASHNKTEQHITLQIQNGSDPNALIPVSLDGMEKLAAWLTQRLMEIRGLAG